MSFNIVVIVILVLLLLTSGFAGIKVYCSTHEKLEIEKEEHDKFERLFKFMGKWMEAEENGVSIVAKIRTLDKNIVVLGDNPIAKVLKNKLDKSGIIYRAETDAEACVGAGCVLVTDISKYEKWDSKLRKLGLESISLEDLFYGK